MKRFFLMCVALMGLWGCSSVKIDEYRAETPVLELRDYFDGTIDAWGMFQDRSGKVVKRFHVLIEASWQGDTGTLDEQFTYSDGTTQRRVWTITRLGPGRYSGRADDVVGEAAGEAAGNALRWRYVLDAKREDGSTIHLDMDDWMWLVDERTLINKTAFSKFGIAFGEVTIFFRKR